MSCWIKHCIILLLLGGNMTTAAAQKDSILTVLGMYTYIVEPVSEFMQFSFVENGVTCGPNAQFETIEEQYNFFVYEIIGNAEISKRITLVDKVENYFMTQPQRTYAFAYDSEDEMKQMYNWAKEGFAENFEYYKEYAKEELADQDKAAIEALKDAEKRAGQISKLLGYTEVELLSIDDNTAGLFSILGLRAARNSENKVKSSYRKASDRDKNYYLRVTFKLK